MRAKLIQVIETQSMRGLGKDDSTLRSVTEYWSLDGKLLAECDVCHPVRELTPHEQKNYDKEVIRGH